MKKIFIYLLLNFFVAENLFAQKEDRNWVFGDSIRIDFNNLSNPTVHHANCYNNETNASISDKNGGLLMYINTKDYWLGGFLYCQIINKQDELMENGDSIYNWYSASNGALFFPFPGDSMKYYFFSTGVGIGTNGFRLFYSIIDLSYNSGLGKVISKNNLLIDSLTEHLVAVKHGNGRDWWVISKNKNTNQYIKYLVSPAGVSGPFFQTIGSISYQKIGECAATKDGSKLCFISWYRNIDVFSFDRCTGIFSNWIELGTPPYNVIDTTLAQVYGCAFSQDGNRLYVTINNGSLTQTKIEQFSFNNTNPIDTKTDILIPTSGVAFFQLELAPDDRIYIAGGWGSGATVDSSYNFLSIINSPNDSATACNLDLYSLYLNGYFISLGLPNMPHYDLSALDENPCDTLNLSINNIKKNSSITISPNPTDGNFTITSSVAIQQIEVINLLGEKVYALRCNTSTQTMHLTSLGKGVYFISIKTADGLVMKKVVVE